MTKTRYKIVTVFFIAILAVLLIVSFVNKKEVSYIKPTIDIKNTPTVIENKVFSNNLNKNQVQVFVFHSFFQN